jgi:hypothetical protein
MAYVRIFGFLVFFLVLANLSSAAACSQKAYEATCNKCEFDENGKLDQKCYQGHQSSGISCLFAAYPVESINYQMNGCDAVDTCRSRLETCKALFSADNDQDDCYAGNIDHCFISADRCVDAAIKKCDEEPPDDLAGLLPDAGWCDGLFFLFVPLFAGLLFVKRRQ